jgi:3',5'-cyclic AMP phosphodiesterase CpdA
LSVIIKTLFLNGMTGAIAFDSSVSSQDVYLQANGSDLIVKIRNNPTDSIVVSGDLTNTSGTVTSGINQLKFSDGSVLNLGGQGSPLTFTWLLNSGYMGVTGSSYGSNLYEISAANGTVNFVNNAGVGGTNTVKYLKGAGSSAIRLNGVTGAIAFDSSVSAQDVYLQANGSDLIVKIRNDPTDSIVVSGDLTNASGTVTSGINQLKFSDGSVVNLGGAGNLPTFDWIGNVAGYTITGSTFGTNVYELTAGGKVNFGNNGAVGAQISSNSTRAARTSPWRSMAIAASWISVRASPLRTSTGSPTTTAT